MGIFSLGETVSGHGQGDGSVEFFEIEENNVINAVNIIRVNRMEAFKNDEIHVDLDSNDEFEVTYILYAHDDINKYNHHLLLWCDKYIDNESIHRPPRYTCIPQPTTPELIAEWTSFMDTSKRVGIPQILIDIQNYLKQTNIQISDKVEGEGRGGSLKDEGSIKRALMNHNIFQHHIMDEKARKFGDMVVLDYDEKSKYVVNIKTSIGSTDNAFSKAGIVYALTDLPSESIPSAMNFAKMNELIDNHRANVPGRDYWFLCVDKKDSSNVMVRGAKQVRHWIVNINPSNVLQIDWKKEKKCLPVHRTWEESYDVLVGGAKKSLKGFFDSLPQDWKEQIMAA